MDVNADVLSLLRGAVKNEREEAETVYPAFAQQAREEGFADIARRFELIGAVERTHADKLQYALELLESGQLFRAEAGTTWICLNCGYVFTGEEAPATCPSCDHAQGYFVRSELSPFL